jgi:Glycosyltransferase Family 4
VKILHVTYSFPPEPPGGTDLYVQSLCTYLTRLGIDTVIAVPGPHDQAYTANGLRARRFRHQEGAPRADLFEGNARSAAAFAQILDDESPDVVHLHALTPACSHLFVGEAKRRDMPTVFTLHTPTVTCQRGTLLRFGKEPCDGRIDVATCTSCAVDALGIPQIAARVLGAVPPSAGDLFGRLSLRGSSSKALRMPSLVERRQAILRLLFEDVDRFVALSGLKTCSG